MTSPKSKIAFVQKDGWNISCACMVMKEGLEKLGYVVEEVSEYEIPGLVKSGKMNRNTPFKGTARAVRAAFKLICNGKEPANMDVPKELRTKQLCNRKFKETTLGWCRMQQYKNSGFANKWHVKALNHHKQFKGQKLHHWFESGEAGVYMDEFPVLLSEYIPMNSETRVFVFKGKIINAHRITPSQNRITPSQKRFVESVVKAWKTNPNVAYAVDIASSSGKYVIVEFNELWSCGLYNVDAKKAAKAHVARWNQIMTELCS